MAGSESEAAHFHSDSGTVTSKLVYVSVKALQWVAIKEVVQGVTDVHPAVQGCWEETDLLVKEFLNHLCPCLSWRR
eukprot:14803455-Ditylum_brightwellii.AAC.1